MCPCATAAITPISKDQIQSAFDHAQTQHPRLFIDKDTFPTLRQSLSTSPPRQLLRDQIIHDAQELLNTEPLQRKLRGIRLLHISRQAIHRILQLSTAWHLTDDPAYVRRAEQEMITLANFSDWNPSHFLDVAEMTTALAIGYDWLYDQLSPQARTTIRQAIIDKGLKPSLKSTPRNWWIKGHNNWNQVCHTGMVLGALAVMDDDTTLAQQLVHRAVNEVQTLMEVYEPDGAYPEGASYWGYGTTYNVLLIEALNSALNTDFNLSGKHGFSHAADYFLHMTAPTGRFYNYADSGLNCNFLCAVFWFAKHYEKPWLTWHQQKLWQQADEKPALLTQDRFAPLALLWAQPNHDTPPSLSWFGRGQTPVVFFRTSWNDSAVYLAAKAGSPAASHAHMDIGSFIIEADTVRWAIDLGPENYNKIESMGMSLWDRNPDSDRWKLFRYNNASHNTLVVNGQNQHVENHSRIVRYSNQSSARYAVIDLQPAYQNQLARIQRGLRLYDQGHILIQDELTAPESNSDNSPTTTVRWAIATNADVNIISPRQVVLKQNDKHLTMDILDITPAHAAWQTWSANPDTPYDQPNPNTKMIGFEVKLTPKQTAALAVQMTPGSAPAQQLTHTPIADWPKPQSE